MLAETRARRGALEARSRGTAVVTPRGQVAEMQRARLLSAAVVALDELGWSRVTVAHITGGARVSRRTFYDVFENREDCLLAVLQDTVGRVKDDLAAAGLEGLAWRERVRTGLWRILCFLDREPVLARVCVVQSARGSQRVLEYREETLTRLAVMLGEGESAGRARSCSPLVAEGLVGAALAIVYKRLLIGERARLSGLLGELMSMLVLPYQGPAVASRERARPAPALPAAMVGASGALSGMVDGDDPLRRIPMRLTYRTARALDGVARHPGASNRLVADHAGITDQGQVSKLLSRLQRLGLLTNTGAGHQAKGEPNAWSLTDLGHDVAQRLNLNNDREASR